LKVWQASDGHDIAEILLKVALNTINQINQIKVLQKLQWEKLKKKAVHTNTFFGFNFFVLNRQMFDSLHELLVPKDSRKYHVPGEPPTMGKQLVNFIT
jgi:hypothetical protein